ncbi:MAG: extracellular solute-binding protein [Nitrospiraceae bacterium]|nr:extracellular solute-binding protein [Nitrospiraceae bacterium]
MTLGALLWTWAANGLEPVTLYYWGTDNDVLALDLIQEFENTHDGSNGGPPIKVVMGQTAVMGKDSDAQRLLCSVMGGDPPDVVWLGRNIVAAWASKGAFTSMQPFLERDWAERPDDPWTLWPEQFYAHCWDEAHYDGQLYAMPATTDVRVLFYNVDILEKHAEDLIAIGCVDPNDPSRPGPPRTWKQLKQCAELLTEFDENGRLSQVGFIPNYGNAWLCLYAWLNGGEFMSADGRTCTMNAPEITEALVYMTELYDVMGGVEAVRAFESALPSGDMDPFLTGKVAMKIDCDAWVGRMASGNPGFRFGAALPPAPEGKPHTSWSGGWCWVIPAQTKHPDEAWEFVKFLASKRAYQMRKDAMRQAVKAAGNVFVPDLSARRDVTEWAMQHYVYDDPDIDAKYKQAMRMVLEALPVARYRPVTPIGQRWWNEHIRATDAGLYKHYDATDLRRNAQLALDRGTAELQAELDRIYKPSPYPQLSWRPIFAGYIILLFASAFALYLYFNRTMQARGYFRREFRAGYLFAAPWFIGFVIFGGGPILFSLVMSLCRYDVFNPPQFVGLRNFAELFTGDPLFYKALWNTVFMALGVPLGMILGLSIAMLLNHEIRGMAVYRTFFYLPAIMPAVAASILWIWIFNPQQGILNNLLAQFGIAGPGWLQNKFWSKPALILMGLWGAGGGMVVWLAGLKAIPAHLYEAARLDGAGRLRCFLHITVPMLSPYIFFNLIMGLIGTFQIFTQAYIMTQGGPVDSTLFYAYALFNNAFRYLRMGYASAMAWVLFGIVLTLTIIQLRISRHWVHYESES